MQKLSFMVKIPWVQPKYLYGIDSMLPYYIVDKGYSVSLNYLNYSTNVERNN